MRAPNFFIVGAPRAGTTSLYHYLDQHPAIYMSPIKEPSFFSPEVVELTPRAKDIFAADAAAVQAYLDGPMTEKRDRGFVLEWAQYLKLFKHATNETAVGEASVAYLGSYGAPWAIRARIPDARIVMMLRDPVDRLYSHFVALRAVGEADRPFVEWAAGEVPADAARRTRSGPDWPGRYALHLRRYLDAFRHDQVRVSLYEDYVHDPRTVVKNLLTFLRVDPEYPIDLRRRHNVTLVPRWPALHHRALRSARQAIRSVVPAAVSARARTWYLTPLSRGPTAGERAQVREMLEADIRALETLIDRDLSGWLDPRPAA